MGASEPGYAAFEGDRCIAAGELREVARSAKLILDRRPDASLLVFDHVTGVALELDFRGSVQDVLARLSAAFEVAAEQTSAADPAISRGPGRPKLGVVAREITLLPRHWQWLAQQPGGASVTIRTLVEEARRASESSDRIRRAQEAAYRFMSVIAGDKPHYEEAIRALFADDADTFETMIAAWPSDVRRHTLRLADRAFDRESQESPGSAG